MALSLLRLSTRFAVSNSYPPGEQLMRINACGSATVFHINNRHTPVGIGALVGWRVPYVEAGRRLGQQFSTLEGNTMTTYVTLYNFTDQGLKTIKDSVKRTEAATKAAAAMGMKVKEVLWTQGQYDLIVISEASDEVKATAFGLNTIKLGNVRGQTLRAFTAAEMGKILEHVA